MVAYSQLNELEPLNTGPYDNYSLQDSHVLPGLLHKAYLSSTNGSPFIVWGSGKVQSARNAVLHVCISSLRYQPVRQFIFSRDLARIIIWRTLQDDSTEAMIATPGGIDCEVCLR